MNILKKVLVCGASLVMVASLGTGINNVSAKRVHHHNRTARIYNKRNHKHAKRNTRSLRNNQYKSVQRYLNYVKKYDAHHTHKLNNYKLRHLNKYMNYLNRNQKRQLSNELVQINKATVHTKNTRRSKRARNHKRNKRISHRVSRRRMNKKVRKHSKKRRLPKVTKVIVQTPSKNESNNASNNSSNQSKWDSNLTAKENEKIDNDVRKLPEPTRDTVRKQLQFSTEKAIKFNAMPKWENVTNQKQYNQDAKMAEAETKAHPSAVRDMWNMPDTYEYAHVAPVKAWIAYDPMYYSHVIKLLYPDGGVVVYPSGLDGRYPSNSLRNYYGYEKFAKKHPQKAYNWLLHPITNYNEFDDGEESSVGHDYTPVGPGIPYHD